VRQLVDLGELLDALADGFAALSAGAVDAAPRNEIAPPGGGFLLSMPGHRSGGDLTVKVVTLFEDNAERGLPAHLATIGLYDAATGACRAFMDGTYVTALRTSAAAALSARLLARPDARVLTLVGAGVQGRNHLRVFPLVRDLEEIRIASRDAEGAERLAAEHPRARAVEDVEAAMRDSDLVALATSAAEPVIAADWVRAGTHVTSVGYRPPRGELPPALLERARLFVESRDAFESPPVGCAELAGVAPERGTELGQVVAGTRPGRRSPEEITVYKAMGHVMEDIVAAELALRAADARGVGEVVTL
jgi:alanine dehydrogenase